MSVHPYLSNKSLKKQKNIHVSRDKKEFPFFVGCTLCLNGSNKCHKTKLFKNPCEKYWHLVRMHQNPKIGDSKKEKKLFDLELENLKELSIANHNEILFNRRNFD